MASSNVEKGGVAENVDPVSLALIESDSKEITISTSTGNVPEERISSTLAANAPEGGVSSTLAKDDPDEKMDSTRTGNNSGEESSSSDTLASLGDSSSTETGDWESYLSREGVPSMLVGNLPEKRMPSTIVRKASERGIASTLTDYDPEGKLDSPRAGKRSGEPSGSQISLGYSSKSPDWESSPKKKSKMAEETSTKSALSHASQQLKRKHDIFANKLFDMLFERSIKVRNPYITYEKNENKFLETVTLAIRTIAYVNRALYRKKYRQWEMEGLPENPECVRFCALTRTVANDKYYFISYLKWIAFLFDLFMYCFKDKYDYIPMGIDIIANNTDLEYFQVAGGKRKLYGIAKMIVERYSRHLPFLIAMESPMDETLHPVLLQLDCIIRVESEPCSMLPPEDLLKVKAVRERLAEKFTVLHNENRHTITGQYVVMKKEETLLKKCLEEEDLAVLVPLATESSESEKEKKVSIELSPDLSSDSESESSESTTFPEGCAKVFGKLTCEDLGVLARLTKSGPLSTVFESDSLPTESEPSQTDTTERGSLSTASVPAEASSKVEQAAASAGIQATVPSHSRDENLEDLGASTSESKSTEFIFKYKTHYIDNSNNAAEVEYDLKFSSPELDEKQPAEQKPAQQQPSQKQSRRKRSKRKSKKKK